MTIIGACLLAVLLVVAGVTVMQRNRARLRAETPHHDQKGHDAKAQRVRKAQRAQSRHDRRKH